MKIIGIGENHFEYKTEISGLKDYTQLIFTKPDWLLVTGNKVCNIYKNV